MAVHQASGAQGRAVGRAPVEPVLLCGDRQRQEQGTGGTVYPDTERQGIGTGTHREGTPAPGGGTA